MGKKKIVLDTNIFISALGWKGKPKEIFNRIIDHEFELILSHHQLEELQRVIEYQKFNFSEDQKTQFLAIILEVATLVETSQNVYVIEEDPDDNRILEAAIAGKADYIISGDEHLLQLKEYQTIKILNADNFLKLLR